MFALQPLRGVQPLCALACGRTPPILLIQRGAAARVRNHHRSVKTILGPQGEKAVPAISKRLKEDARQRFVVMDTDDSGAVEPKEYTDGIDTAFKGFMERFADLAVKALIHGEHEDL
jgi:hypothetical protein